MRDLSHPLTAGMQVYPGDPAVHLHPVLQLETDGVAVTLLELGSHSGTHVDAPAHTIAGGRTMDRIALDELVGDALILHVPDLADHAIVGMEALGGLPDRVPPIVVLDLGWAQHFGTAKALAHPAVHVDVARTLLDRGMHVLGVDTLSPDPTDPAGVAEFPVHEVVLGSDCLIVENVAAVSGLPARLRIGIFPLRLSGDGAPARVVAFDAAEQLPPRSRTD